MSEVITKKGGAGVILLILALVIVAGLVYYLFFQKEGSTEGGGCVKVNRAKFPVRWEQENIPGGTIGDIAQTYFGTNDPTVGTLVSGFFKGIDVYPSATAGKYYQHQLRTFVNSEEGLPQWNMIQGELSCDKI